MKSCTWSSRIFIVILSCMMLFVCCNSFSHPVCSDNLQYTFKAAQTQIGSMQGNIRLDCQLPEKHIGNVIDSMRQLVAVRWRNEETILLAEYYARLLSGIAFGIFLFFCFRYKRGNRTLSLCYQICYIHQLDGKKRNAFCNHPL